MEKAIRDYLKPVTLRRKKLKGRQSKESIQKIYQLFHQGLTMIPTTAVEFLYAGIHAQMGGNYYCMHLYYDSAIKLGSIEAMANLAYHYRYEQIWTAKMLSYYQLAIAAGDVHSMYELGNYYEEVGNFSLMIPLYERASTARCSAATLALGNHYRYVLTDIDRMLKCYQLVYSRKDDLSTEAWHQLKNYYQEHPSVRGLLWAREFEEEKLTHQCLRYLTKKNTVLSSSDWHLLLSIPRTQLPLSLTKGRDQHVRELLSSLPRFSLHQMKDITTIIVTLVQQT